MTNFCARALETSQALAWLKFALSVGMAAGLPAMAACGGRANEERPPQDAAPGAETTNVGHPTPASDVVGADALTDGAGEDRDASEAADAMDLLPIASPPASDDMRLAGFGNENMGGTPNGWDFCFRGLTLCPYSCDGAPPGSRGPRYIRYSGGSGPSGPSSCPDAQNCPSFCPDAQVFAYFTPPIAANTRIGVWFDLIRLSAILPAPTGTVFSSDATLTIYATQGCLTRETLGTWRMTAVLSELQVWKTTCVNITPSASAGELGFRFAGSGDIGMDALRFGPACPQ